MEQKNYTKEERDKAIEGLDRIAEGLTGDDLKKAMTNYVKDLPVDAKGETTVLYSNQIRENKIHTGRIVVALQEHNQEQISKGEGKPYRFIDDTLSASVLTSSEFSVMTAKALALKDENGKEPRDAEGWMNALSNVKRNTPKGDELTDFLYDGRDGLWALKSKQFTSLTEGEVVIVAENPGKNSVLIQTEMMNLLNDSKASKINHISVETLNDMVDNKGEDYTKSTLVSLSAMKSIATDFKPDNTKPFIEVTNIEKLVTSVSKASEPLTKELKQKLDETERGFGKFESLGSLAMGEIVKNNKIEEAQAGRTYTGNVVGMNANQFVTKSVTGKYVAHDNAQANQFDNSVLNKKIKLQYDSNKTATIKDMHNKNLERRLDKESEIKNTIEKEGFSK